MAGRALCNDKLGSTGVLMARSHRHEDGAALVVNGQVNRGQGILGGQWRLIKQSDPTHLNPPTGAPLVGAHPASPTRLERTCNLCCN